MAVIRQGNPNRICVHHSACSPGADNLSDLKQRLAQYETTHSQKSWAETTKTGGEHGYSYLAYHIAVAKDGHELRTQDDKYVLYHAGDNARGKDSFNLHGIGVLLDGNYETELPTAHQKEALARIIARFERKYGVDVLVRGHKQTSLSGTACPGKNIGDNTSGFLTEAIERANEILKNNETDEPLNTSQVAPGSNLEELKRELEELRVKYAQIEATVAEKNEAIRQLTENEQKWQKEAKSANDNLGKVLEERGELEKIIASLERKIDKLEKELAEMEKEKNNNWQLYKKALEGQTDKQTSLQLAEILFNRLYTRMKFFFVKKSVDSPNTK
jgi:tetratricopeptide (TPR) repeat protein